MKISEKIKSMMMVLMCIMTLVGLNSCSDDDELPQDDSEKAVGYKFSLSLNQIEGTDHADLINTTYHYIDHEGKEIEMTFDEKSSKHVSVQSQIYTKLPNNLVVTVKETLRPGVTLNKEVYKMGLGISFSINSVNKNGTSIKQQNFIKDNSIPIKAEDLSEIYPHITTFSYSIAADGTISLK